MTDKEVVCLLIVLGCAALIFIRGILREVNDE